jgi:hypothetical protein
MQQQQQQDNTPGSAATCGTAARSAYHSTTVTADMLIFCTMDCPSIDVVSAAAAAAVTALCALLCYGSSLRCCNSAFGLACILQFPIAVPHQVRLLTHSQAS